MKKIIMILLLLVTVSSISFSESYSNFSEEEKVFLKQKATKIEFFAIMAVAGIYGLCDDDKTSSKAAASSVLTVVGTYCFIYQILTIEF